MSSISRSGPRPFAGSSNRVEHGTRPSPTAARPAARTDAVSSFDATREVARPKGEGFDGAKQAIASGSNANNAPYGVTLAGFDLDHAKEVFEQYPPEAVAQKPDELIPRTAKALVLAYVVENKVEADATWAPRAADALNRKYNTNVFQATDGETLCFGNECVHSAPNGHGMARGTFNPNARGELIWITTGTDEPFVRPGGQVVAPSLTALPARFTLDFADWSAWGVDASHLFDAKDKTETEARSPRYKFMETWARLRSEDPRRSGPSQSNLLAVAEAMGRAGVAARVVDDALVLPDGAGLVRVAHDTSGGGLFELAPEPSSIFGLTRQQLQIGG